MNNYQIDAIRLRTGEFYKRDANGCTGIRVADGNPSVYVDIEDGWLVEVTLRNIAFIIWHDDNLPMPEPISAASAEDVETPIETGSQNDEGVARR